MNEFHEEELKKYKRYINYIIKNNEEEQIENIQWNNKKTEYKLFKICNSISEKKMDTIELHYWRLIRLYIISLSILMSLKSKDRVNLYEIKSIIYKIRYYLDYLGSNLAKPVKERDIGLDSTNDINELDDNRKFIFDFLYHLPIETELNAKKKKKYKLMYILLDLNYSLIDSELLDSELLDDKQDILSNMLELDIIENSDLLIENIKQYLEFYDDNYKYLITTSGGSNFIKNISETAKTAKRRGSNFIKNISKTAKTRSSNFIKNISTIDKTRDSNLIEDIKSRNLLPDSFIEDTLPLEKTTIAKRRVFSGVLLGMTGAIFFSPPVNITAFLLGFLYAGWYESDMYGETDTTWSDRILNYIKKKKYEKNNP